MLVNKIDANKEVVEFDSLHEFHEYINETPFNDSFRWSRHASVDGDEQFTKTSSFEEAEDLYKHGWSDMATNLVQKLKVAESKAQPVMKQKQVLGVCGYQAIVPLYLNGCPNNMISKKSVPIKQKVVTLNKSIGYNAATEADTIIEESIKALQIVKKLEAQGYRCNLNLIVGLCDKFSDGKKEYYIKIRIKSASEKLNVSKVAFPLVHPSMLRRLVFRFMEVYPKVPKVFTWGYGRPAKSPELQAACLNKGEYLLPSFIAKDVNDIKSLEDLQDIC